MGSKKSGNRTGKPRAAGAGRPPSFTKAVDRAVYAVNTLINLAQTHNIDTTELFAAQKSLDWWAVQHSDHEIKTKTKHKPASS